MLLASSGEIANAAVIDATMSAIDTTAIFSLPDMKFSSSFNLRFATLRRAADAQIQGFNSQLVGAEDIAVADRFCQPRSFHYVRDLLLGAADNQSDSAFPQTLDQVPQSFDSGSIQIIYAVSGNQNELHVGVVPFQLQHGVFKKR